MDPIQTSDLQPENRAIEHSTNVPAPSLSGVTQVVVATLAMAFVVVVSHVMFAPAPVVTSHSAPPMRSSTSSQMAMSSSSLHAAAQPARKKLPPMSRPPHRVAVTKTPVRPSTQRASSTSSVSFVDASSEPSHVAAEEPYVFQVSLPTDLVVSFISKPVDPRQRVGVYLTASSMADDDMRQYTIKELLAAGGDTLVFDVKGSAVYFHSAAPLATQLNLVKPAYDLPAIIREAHENGIYVIGRFVAIKDMSLSGALPETQIRHPVTEKSVGSTWVDPAHPTVITYNMEILRELVASGIDEVNFDYIRYPTEYYPDITTIGLTGQQKADHLVEFLKAARAVVDEYGSSTVLGVSTYAIIGWDFAKNVESVGQDIARFAPYVDIVSPMAYPATFAINAYYDPARDPGSRMYYLVYRTLQGYKELLGEEGVHKLRPWIQGYGITNKNLRDQIQGVTDAGMCGFTVWNADNAYKPVYDVLKNWEKPASCGDLTTNT